MGRLAYYAYDCARCGAESPRARSATDASSLAAWAGWERRGEEWVCDLCARRELRKVR